MQWSATTTFRRTGGSIPTSRRCTADLSGLPPAIFSVGTLDPLLDDSLFMHAPLGGGREPAELHVYPGAIHGFIGFPLAIARRASDHIVHFVRQS